MTTVDYGDFYPQTTLGRFFVGIPTMLLGIAILAILLKTFKIISLKSKKLRGLSTMKEDNHIVILGYGEQQIQEIVKEIQLDDRGNYGNSFGKSNRRKSRSSQKLKVHFVKGIQFIPSIIKTNLKVPKSYYSC